MPTETFVKLDKLQKIVQHNKKHCKNMCKKPNTSTTVYTSACLVCSGISSICIKMMSWMWVSHEPQKGRNKNIST